MLKRTLFFSNPAHLSLKDKQMVIKPREGEAVQAPIEDLGFVVIEHQQISVSLPLLDELVAHNVAVIFCNNKHMPHAMLFPLDGNHLQTELYRQQVQASEPLKKQLWKQTVEAKINNQAGLLTVLGKPNGQLEGLARQVKSGDSTGREGFAAKLYWKSLLGNDFLRERHGRPPNNLLNYGYIVLRAAVARALTGSALLPPFGIHHHNRYNAYCLADDIMEPFRPFVDWKVHELNEKYPGMDKLEKEIKAELLDFLTFDLYYEKCVRPLMVGLAQTTASLARCIGGKQKKIEYPALRAAG